MKTLLLLKFLSGTPEVEEFFLWEFPNYSACKVAEKRFIKDYPKTIIESSCHEMKERWL